MFKEDTIKRIESKFNELIKNLAFMEHIEEKFNDYEENIALAMKYLYITMPYSDIGNYSFEIFLDYAKQGIELWERGPFKGKIPEDIFLNYVLYHRVNEEEISTCRTFFYDKLKNRVKGLSMKAAVLEVNYWCCEEATYQSTDDRTMAPIDVYKGGYGRCGEESTFTVSALRSVGIPARQVYAPKWSHCDDNHAWVEAWCDGEWYFLGACEPEEILNKGWFTNAASRAMVVHSRWFDFIKPEEEIIGKEGFVTIINNISRYAKAEKILITVVDEEGKPIEGASVDFEVLNYSELTPIATQWTDDNGRVTISLGVGSLHVHASKDGIFSQVLLDTRKEKYSILTLTKNRERANGWKEFDFIAPVDSPVNIDKPNEQQREIGKKKYALATEKRLTKVKKLQRKDIENFLRVYENTRSLKEKLLKELSEKDKNTFNVQVLEEHFLFALPYIKNYDEKIFIKYLMNPRIYHEPLTKYREYISLYFPEKTLEIFKEQPYSIWEWIEKNISTLEEKERTSIVTSPVGCLKLGIGSSLSKKILFVAIARTCGIPARLNENDGAVEYWSEDTFVSLLEVEEKSASIVFKSEKEDITWTYRQNWSLSCLEKGVYSTLNLSQEQWSNGKLTLKLKPGTYRVITSNRLPNGNIFAKELIIEIKQGEVIQVSLSLREAKLSDMLEKIAIDNFTLMNERQESIDGSKLTEGGKKIFFWLEEGKEPTEHILNELMERTTDFKKYINNLIFIIRDKEVLKDSTISKVQNNLGHVQVYYDDFKENVQTLGRRMYVDPDKLPLIVVTDKKLNGIYATSGYNVGTGDMLLRILK